MLMWLLDTFFGGSRFRPAAALVFRGYFCNQLASSGHRVEYGGITTGDFKIDGDVVIEVGREDKGFCQMKGEEKGYVAADGIESAVFRKIPL